MGGIISAVGDIAGSALHSVTGLPASSIIGGLSSLGGSAIASNAQQSAASDAASVQRDMFNITQNNLQPYMQTGQLANTAIQNATGLNTSNPLTSSLLKAPTMTQSQLTSTPGYQFNLTQGLKSVQNGAAARGLGSSGAAQKGAAAYATGLADSTYQNQFNNAVTNQTNQFNRLNTLAGGGQNAAAGLGGIGQQTASNIGNSITGSGNAQGAAAISGATGFGNALQTGQALNQLKDMYGNRVDDAFDAGYDNMLNGDWS